MQGFKKPAKSCSAPESPPSAAFFSAPLLVSSCCKSSGVTQPLPERVEILTQRPLGPKVLVWSPWLPTIAFMAPVEVLISHGLVRPQGGSLDDQYLLAASLPPHPGLPLGALISASTSHRNSRNPWVQTTLTCHQITSIHPLNSLGLPMLQGQLPCPQMPPYSNRNCTVCQIRPHYAKGELKQFHKSLRKSGRLSQLSSFFLLCSPSFSGSRQQASWPSL